MFQRFEIRGWRQFSDVKIQLHPVLTILTGANGSGKTTILAILSRHFGWSILFVGVPTRSDTGVVSYLSGYWERIKGSLTATTHIIGLIEYSNGAIANLQVNDQVSQAYQVDITGMQAVEGLHIPSHRPVYVYQAITAIPVTAKTPSQVFTEYANDVRSRYLGGGGRAVFYSLKENLISLAVFGHGNATVVPNVEARATFEGFQDALRRVLPPTLGFRRIRIEIPEVVLECASGDFALDAVSGGVAAVLDLVWQIYMFAKDKKRCVITIDEPENHLHPQMQKRILPDLIAAFPQCQFIAATHNPLVVSSVADSNVYVLDYDVENRVRSRYLDMVNKAGSSNEILRDVLGLDYTFPSWAEERLRDITEKYTQEEVSEQSLNSMKMEMEGLGLGRLFPTATSQMLRKKKRQ